MYKYYSILRPVGPGTHPKKGFIGFKNYDNRTYIESIDHDAWGEIYYENKLDDKAKNSYDLVEDKANNGCKKIFIVNIDELPDVGENAYFVEFNDGTRYESANADNADRIEYLRIGDEYKCFDDFIKDIHGEEVEVTYHPIAKATGRYTVSVNGDIMDCDSLDAYASDIENARNGKGGLSIFDNETREMLFFKYDGRETYIDNLK